MIITEKTKYKDVLRKSIILDMAKADLVNDIRQWEVPMFIGGIKVKSGFDIPFSGITDFWDCTNEDDYFRLVIENYLGNAPIKTVMNLPFIQVYRLMVHAKDIVEQSMDRFSALKTKHSPEELEAGIEDMKGSEFTLIRYWLSISSLALNSFDVAYSTPWTIIVSELEDDFQKRNYMDRYNEVIIKKNKR